MNIIGISGFEAAVPFKREQWPGLEEREYRIVQGHDGAAALLTKGHVVAAAAEERFCRRKHTGEFPKLAMQYCLANAGIKIEDIDEIVHAFDYRPYQRLYQFDPISRLQYETVFSREAILARLNTEFPDFPDDRLIQVEHHLAHAASAFFTSGWNDCLVIVVDGMGEADGASIFHGKDNQLERLGRVSALDSIGILYSVITLHLGFDFNSDEYKIMGMAPYGDPSRFKSFFDESVQLQDDGSIRIPLLKLNNSREERETYAATRRHLDQHLIERRHPDGDILQEHRDVAAALQDCLDQAMIHLCGTFSRTTGLKRLALAGGVALNCTANGHLIRSGLFEEVYVYPAAGDDGAAVGAALLRGASRQAVENRRCPIPFLGPSYEQTEVEAALEKYQDRVETTAYISLEETCTAAATRIADGMVIAWHRGRMEFGPRALGNRSILADPSHPEMRDRVNQMVKKRESFRPFAPAVTIEEVDKWFEVDKGQELPYMTVIVPVRLDHRQELPAITHVNGSARVQTVSHQGNPDFHTLLQSVGKATGREMVLNTSFNVKGQPIVNTPEEAIETFLGTNIDCLFVENNLVIRKGQ